MARRKRIPYDPPGHRKRRRGWSDGNSRRVDQTLISRRLLLAKGAVVATFAGLAGKLGYMQLAEGANYTRRAEDNIISRELIPAPRGLILDRQGRTLASNRRSWAISVIPNKLPKDKVERQYVLDTLITALQLPDALVVDPDAVPLGSSGTVYTRIATMLSYDADVIPDAFQGWKNQEKNGLILITTLSIDEAARFRAANAELPGVTVMNQLEYLVKNVWDGDLEVSVMRNVSRQVAMTLEANSMYLPGVLFDDSALVRQYSGGQVMSHVVGYVTGINAIELTDIRNLDRNGEQIYRQNDLIGKAGLEVALEDQLRGKKGSRSVEKDALGVQIRVVPESTIDPVPGQNVKLTVDLELQNAAGKALGDQIMKAATAKKIVNDARVAVGAKPWIVPQAGSVVALDPRTGEVLTMVSAPHYDNQLFISGLSNLKWGEYTNEDKGKAFVNRATSELYAPGSTFKSFLAASALSRGSLTTSDVHTCEGGIGVPNSDNLADLSAWACWVAWHSGAGRHGELDVYEALAQSCDTFFYNVAPSRTTVGSGENNFAFYYDFNLNIGTAGQVVNDTRHEFNGEGIDHIAEDMSKKFYFGRHTGIEIDEVKGLVPSKEWKAETIPEETWNVGDSLNVSIGQGEFQATPLQLAMNVAGIAALGNLKTPHLVHTMTDQDGNATAPKIPDAGKLGIEEKHLDVVIEGMRRVCNEATGTGFQNGDGSSKWALTNPEGEEKIVVCGKTGTAEFGEPDKRNLGSKGEVKAGARDTHALFTAFAPMENPEIAVAVVIEAGGEGATYAVPVADAVIRAYFELTGRRKRGKVLSKDKLPIA
jgi:penicillin-binding protein 2